jgi:hypothetical protein
LGSKAKWEYSPVVYECYHKSGRDAKKLILDELCRNISAVHNAPSMFIVVLRVGSKLRRVYRPFSREEGHQRSLPPRVTIVTEMRSSVSGITWILGPNLGKYWPV